MSKQTHHTPSRFAKYSKATLVKVLDRIVEVDPDDRNTAVLINVDRIEEYELDTRIERIQEQTMKASAAIAKRQKQAIALAEQRAELKRNSGRSTT